MMTRGHARLMAAYNTEMNARLCAAADGLTEAERREDRGAFFGSVQGTLSHLLWADTIWMHRFDGWEAPPCGIPGSAALHQDWAALKAARRAADARIEAWALGLEEAWLAAPFAYRNSAGKEMPARPAWILVAHLFNHQTHHRGQVHALLTGFGRKTGDTDLPWAVDLAALGLV
jgi:uncharacterized damage-inducible protein DinB